MAERKRLTADDWTATALSALADGGLAAVAVEPIAARLGATKGSFYWHFAGRDALVEAVLLLWERTSTEDVIAQVEAVPAGVARLRTLLTAAMARHPGSSGARAELALQATATHPLVAPVLARVTKRRLAYLAGLFADLGFTPDDAARRGLLAYTAYLGHAQMVHATPDVTDVANTPAYADTVIAALTASP